MSRCLLLITILLALSFNLYAEESSIHFAVIGDYGNNKKSEASVAKLVKKKHPQFIITLGDNNYMDGCWSTIDTNIGKYFHKYIGNYKGSYGKGAKENRFFPTLGNHDWDAKKKCYERGKLPYLEYFTLPGNQRYYDFVKGPVHFYAIDSDGREPDGHKMGSKQYKWLVEQIKKSTSKFNIIYFHNAPYSSGQHGSTESMQWNFAELGAQIVMSGHDHIYQRVEQDGVIYLVNGSGGARLYKNDHPIPNTAVFYNKRHGFMWVEADETKMVLKFINNENKVIDTREVYADK